MKSLFKKISFLIIVVMVTISALIYICPMSVSHITKKTIVTATHLCESEPAANSNFGSIPECVNFHLSLITKFIGDAQFILNFLVVFTLLAFSRILFFDHLLDSVWRSLISKFRYFYLRYRGQIKALVEEKILHYLDFVGNHTIAQTL